MPDHATLDVMLPTPVDVGIAPLVVALNRIPGIRTMASCEGTGRSYWPYVTIVWESDEAIATLGQAIIDWHDAGNWARVDEGGAAETAGLNNCYPHQQSATLMVRPEWLERFVEFLSRPAEPHEENKDA